MNVKILILVCVALLNVLIIGIAPKSFEGAGMNYELELTDRHKSIVESLKKGYPISMSDREYLREQSDFLINESMKYAQDNFQGVNRLRLTADSILLVSVVTLTPLVILSVFGLFVNLESLIYFSLTSMLVFLVSPIASGQLFLVITSNLLGFFGVISLFKMFKGRKS